MNIFINHTNHPSANWDEAQKKAAEEYGNIVDITFPEINPLWDSEEVLEEAIKTAEIIKKTKPNAVLCQGEAVYVFHLVNLLKASGIKALAASTKREASEYKNEDGKLQKISYFKFVNFREY